MSPFLFSFCLQSPSKQQWKEWPYSKSLDLPLGVPFAFFPPLTIPPFLSILSRFHTRLALHCLSFAFYFFNLLAVSLTPDPPSSAMVPFTSPPGPVVISARSEPQGGGLVWLFFRGSNHPSQKHTLSPCTYSWWLSLGKTVGLVSFWVGHQKVNRIKVSHGCSH